MYSRLTQLKESATRGSQTSSSNQRMHFVFVFMLLCFPLSCFELKVLLTLFLPLMSLSLWGQLSLSYLLVQWMSSDPCNNMVYEGDDH